MCYRLFRLVDGDIVNHMVTREGCGVIGRGPPIECSVEDNIERTVGYEESGWDPALSGVVKMAVHEPGNGSGIPLNGKHVKFIVEVHFRLLGIRVDPMSTIPLVHTACVTPVISAGRGGGL